MCEYIYIYSCDQREMAGHDVSVTETSIIQSYNVIDEKVDLPSSQIGSNRGKFTFAVTGADVIVSAPFPFIFEHATMVHVLTDKVQEISTVSPPLVASNIVC
jgi:hypothetical protein